MRPNRARLILEVSTSVRGEPPIRFRHLWIKTHPPENVELCCHEALAVSSPFRNEPADQYLCSPARVPYQCGGRCRELQVYQVVSLETTEEL